MPVFDYAALDRSGRGVSGSVTAEGRSAVIEQLVSQGLHPVSVDQRQTPAPAPSRSLLGSTRVSRGSVDAFTRQLANLLTAGVSLGRALHILSREASQTAARTQWAAVRDDVVGGTALGDALAKWPKSFPPVYVAMVRAGETGGFLEVVLEQIADFRSWEQGLKGKIRAALVYPAVLTVLACLVLTFLLTYFIPRFSAIFAEFGGALPWLTRAIVAASNGVLHYGLMILVAVALVVLALRRLLATERGRRGSERMLLRVPVLGTVVARLALVRFCRMLGTLLEGGVSLVSALRVAREAIGNQTLADTITRAVEDVQHGASLSRSLAASRMLFPADMVEMVAVAEESGRLDKELLRIAGAYDAELDRQLGMLVALVEPALLFIMAAVVGTVVIGMLLPVFMLQELIR